MTLLYNHYNIVILTYTKDNSSCYLQRRLVARVMPWMTFILTIKYHLTYIVTVCWDIAIGFPIRGTSKLSFSTLNFHTGNTEQKAHRALRSALPFARLN